MNEPMRIMEYLDNKKSMLTREQWMKSYPSWAHGGKGWDNLNLGGTYIMLALAWYQWIRKPGSKEWRPSIIIDALRNAVRESQPRICCNPDCGWIGAGSECVHPHHWPNDRLCPRCNETTELLV